MALGDKKYIVGRQGTIELTEGPDGFYRDVDDCIYALHKKGQSLDDVDRCGIAPFALPDWDCFRKLNRACTPHDFMYENDVWQAFHTRSESDQLLENLVELAGYDILAPIFHTISAQLGAPAWENDKTRDL